MKDFIKSRTLAVAEYIIENRATVRAAAAELNISKSTVHTDIVKRLPYIDAELYEEIKKLMSFNFSVRHIRGGEATKFKYMKEEDI